MNAELPQPQKICLGNIGVLPLDPKPRTYTISELVMRLEGVRASFGDLPVEKMLPADPPERADDYLLQLQVIDFTDDDGAPVSPGAMPRTLLL